MVHIKKVHQLWMAASAPAALLHVAFKLPLASTVSCCQPHVCTSPSGHAWHQCPYPPHSPDDEAITARMTRPSQGCHSPDDEALAGLMSRLRLRMAAARASCAASWARRSSSAAYSASSRSRFCPSCCALHASAPRTHPSSALCACVKQRDYMRWIITWIMHAHVLPKKMPAGTVSDQLQGNAQHGNTTWVHKLM